MTSLGITIHYRLNYRNIAQEKRIVKVIKKLCEDEQITYGIGYDKLTLVPDSI